MDRFDNFINLLYSAHLYTEADDLPPPPDISAAAGAPARAVPPQNAQTTVATPEPAPLSPEDNAQNDTSDDKSNLPSQKRVQLIKLIALAISTHSPATRDGQTVNSQIQRRMHAARVALQSDTTEGNAAKNENLIINIIAAMQGVDSKDIAAQIDYITPSYNESDVSSYIPKDEYSSLVELAKSAILSSPESLNEIDRSSILASKITSANAEEFLDKIKGALAQSI